MGKSKAGKSKGNVSAGIHSNVARSTLTAMRRDYMNSIDRPLNQQKALRAGKDIVVTIENPNKEQTNKKFIRQRISGKQYLDNIKRNAFRIKGEASE